MFFIILATRKGENMKHEKNLFPYQIEGIEKIVSWNKDVLLADHPGAGKTCQAIIAADKLGCSKILVVCPAGLRANWIKEFQTWGALRDKYTLCYTSKEISSIDELQENSVTVISYDLAGKCKPYSIDLLILDEAHYLKNYKAIRTKVCLNSLWNRAKRKICITGTPLPNGRAIEAYSLFSKLAPKTFGDFRYFTSRFCVKEFTKWGANYNKSKDLTFLGEKARELFMIRRSKKDTIGQLPPMTRITMPLDEDYKRLAPLFDSKNIEEALEALESNRDSQNLSQLRVLLGCEKVRASVTYILNLLEEVSSVVVFAHHRTVIQLLEESFLSTGITYTSVTGETPPAKREEAVRDFQAGKFQVFLGSLLATNTGITLTKATDVVFVECDWVPENNIQAEGRIYRVTQNEHTRSHYLVVPNSLDDFVTRAILKKSKDIYEVMRD